MHACPIEALVATCGPGEYLERLAALRRALAARREGVLLLVSHWGVLNTLAGVDLQPAELATASVEL